jgi:hypothetical protein
MGQFLSMSGIVGGRGPEVVDALRRYAADKGGDLAEESLSFENDGCMVVTEGAGGAAVLYPSGFMGWDDAAAFLSRELRRPVFSFHVHDSDLWMYVLYENGSPVDQFNPVPEYWGELDDEERESWRGDARAVAARVPGLSPDAIARYLVPWGDDVFEGPGRTKAYPDDRYAFGDDWQLADFVRRLGLDYPLGDDGSALGTTYRFTAG